MAAQLALVHLLQVSHTPTHPARCFCLTLVCRLQVCSNIFSEESLPYMIVKDVKLNEQMGFLNASVVLGV